MTVNPVMAAHVLIFMFFSVPDDFTSFVPFNR